MSTPVSLPLLTPALSRNSNRSGTGQPHLCKPNLPDTATTAPYRPPVRVEFPQFGSDEDNDPITFVECCEEYFALRPLTDSEILASLTSVSQGTAKDWWLAERRHIFTWGQFKLDFLHAFLTDDYEAEAAKRLLERMQGPKESIRDFAYH